LLNGYSDKLDNGNMQIRRLLKSFYFDCQVRNLTEKTIWGYGEALSKFLNFVEKKGIELEQVEGATIKEFIVSLRERQLSDHTINQRLRVLKLFFRYLVQEGLWDGRPNPKEIERILKVPNKNTFAGYRNFCIIYAFYDTMIRLSELTNIKLSYPISI
jgi:integrase/recombinase XerD